MTLNWKTLFAITTTVVLWASAFVGIRIGLTGYSPGALALLRFSVASLSMIPVYFSLPKRQTINLRDLPRILWCGIIGITIYNIALNYGEIHVSAGIASFIIGLMPVITILLAIAFLKERISHYSWLGVLISLMGMIIIALSEHHGSSQEISVFYVFIAAICGSVYSVGQKKLLQKFSSIEVVTLLIWAGTLMLFIFLPQLLHDMPHAPMRATLAVIYMGIFPAAIGYGAWSYALSQAPASQVSVFLYLIPLFTMMISYLLLGEIPFLLSIAGGITAIAGALIVQRFK